eukprot:6865026-Prymnesium_polylepis.1
MHCVFPVFPLSDYRYDGPSCNLLCRIKLRNFEILPIPPASQFCGQVCGQVCENDWSAAFRGSTVGKLA